MNRNFSKRQHIGRRMGAALVLLLLLGAALNASNSLIRVKAGVDKAVITIGDRITYTLTIEHAPGVRVEQPGPGANLGQFEIKDFKIYDPVKTDSLVSQRFEYQISVFDTGKFVIPPFPVAFAPSDTARKFQIIRSEAIPIAVKSVLSAEDHEIHDIKPPQGVPFPYRTYALYGGLLLGLIALLTGVYFYLRSRRRGVPFLRKTSIRPAHEIALEALAALKSDWETRFDAGEFKALYTDLTDILRRYLENRFFIPALEATTNEILTALDELDLPQTVREQIGSVLSAADLVKFAKHIPEKSDFPAAVARAEAVIDATRLDLEAVPAEEPAEEAAGAKATEPATVVEETKEGESA